MRKGGIPADILPVKAGRVVMAAGGGGEVIIVIFQLRAILTLPEDNLRIDFALSLNRKSRVWPLFVSRRILPRRRVASPTKLWLTYFSRLTGPSRSSLPLDLCVSRQVLDGPNNCWSGPACGVCPMFPEHRRTLRGWRCCILNTYPGGSHTVRVRSDPVQ